MDEKEKNESEVTQDVSENTTEHESALQTCQQELLHAREQYARVTADLQNFQRRMRQEQSMWMQKAQDDVLSSLLAISDDIDRAFDNVPAHTDTASQDWIKGFELIRGTVQKLLDQYHVVTMDNYDAFNPEFHEALVQVPSDNHASGAIVEVMQKGYMRNDRVLRPARVSVAQ